MSSAVRLAAMIPAISAVPTTEPLGAAPDLTFSNVPTVQRSLPAADATRTLGKEFDAVGFGNTEAVLDEHVANASLDRRIADVGRGIGVLLRDDVAQFGDAAAFVRG